MNYSVESVPKVNRLKRKLTPNLQRTINAEVDKIAQDPYGGERKTGDLSNVFIHKFKHYTLQLLIGYTINEKERKITILAIGPHENFYRDLKRYLSTKSTPSSF